MINKETLRLIDQSMGWRQHRVEMMSLPDGDVVVKGHRAPRGPMRFFLLNTLARITRNPMLQPVPVPGGQVSQQTEVARLQQLAHAGVAVPSVLYAGPRYLIMQRIEGHDLIHGMRNDAASALKAFVMGLCALHDLHHKGQYLSQAFARNMLLHKDHIVFIDFEDDPLLVMPLVHAQVRDWLSYLLSAIWGNQASTQDLMQAWQLSAQQIPEATMQSLLSAVRSLVWMRHLPDQRKPWGRDIVTVQAAAAFLYQWMIESALNSGDLFTRSDT